MIENSSKSANFQRLVGKFWYGWFVAGAFFLALLGLTLLSHGLIHGVTDSKVVGVLALAWALFMWLMTRIHVYVWPRLIAFIERMDRRRASKNLS